MNRIALFPGSFDPITKGHENVIRRALPLFDEIVIGIGLNTQKQYMFSLEKRTEWIESIFAKEEMIRVETYEGLTVDFCKKINANYILRGLRTENDFEFEKNIAQMNHTMEPKIESIFIICDPKYSAITSTIVRDIIKNGSDASQFVPEEVIIQ
ncbi:MAG: pantetheine-phosphate adenylyltransferase [Bacteroidia bacterium]|nr:pantetheine-phosphate adenylyltransferase [Bacteroidia bacterium]